MIQNTALNRWNTLVFHTEVPSVWILKINANQFGKCRQNASKKTYTFRLQFLPKEAAMIEQIRPSLLSGKMRKRKSFLRNARPQDLLSFQCEKTIRSAFRSEGNIVARKLQNGSESCSLAFCDSRKQYSSSLPCSEFGECSDRYPFLRNTFRFFISHHCQPRFFNCWHEFANTNVKSALMFMPRSLTCYDNGPVGCYEIALSGWSARQIAIEIL